MALSIRALIFDFDGLILDTESPSFRAWKEVYTEHGADLDETDWHAAIGTVDAVDPYALLLERATRPVAPELELRASKEDRHRELVAAEAVLPGVVEWLVEATALGLQLGVASASPIEWVDGHLHRLGLRTHFTVVSCRTDQLRPKPAPDVYLGALERLGRKASEAVAVEDSPNGIKAAKAAGLFCVAVPNPMTRPLDFSAADLVLESLADLPLPELVARLEQ